MPGIGALIHLLSPRSTTLGMSLVWQGLAILLLPKPGGAPPSWLASVMGFAPPFVPFPIVAAVVIALAVHFGLMTSSYGVVLRGAGGNAQAIGRAGWSLLRTKVVMFALAGVFGVLSGMALIGITTSADANIGNGYTLLSIAGVILGGGEFVGGRVSPIGAVIGALTLALAASPLLTFMHIPADWQSGANGVILIVVLAARALLGRRGRPQNGATQQALCQAVDPELSPEALVVTGPRPSPSPAATAPARMDHCSPVARRVHRHRRHQLDVRHLPRAGQCRSVAARQYRARQRRRR